MLGENDSQPRTRVGKDTRPAVREHEMLTRTFDRESKDVLDE